MAVASVSAFDFHQYFQGEWTVAMTDGAEQLYSVRAGDGGALTGEIRGTDGAVTSQLKVEFADASVSDGALLLARDGATWHRLFAFAFAPRANGVVSAGGLWTPVGEREAAGQFEFVVVSERQFVIVVLLHNTTRLVVSGAKSVAAVEQTFFQKYGMMMFMFVFMIGSQYMKYRMGQPPASARPAGNANKAQGKSK